MESEQPEDSGRRRRRRIVGWLAGSAGVVAILAVGAWTQRKPIARNFISSKLQSLGVRARYDLVTIGPRTQRIENIALGDPKRPDLTAKWVEVDVALSGVTAVRAGGVRLHGRLHDGVLSLGELDKFRDPKSTAPFSMPDMILGLNDARMRLDTDYGPVGLKVEGEGYLRDGFAGKLAAVMPAAKFGGCAIDHATAWVDVRMKAGEPRLTGPLRASALACAQAGFTLARPVIDADVTLGKALDRWAGQMKFAGEAARGQGMLLSRPSGTLIFDGNAASTRGQLALAAQAGGMQGVTSGPLAVDARWLAGTGLVQAQGTASLSGLHHGSDDPLHSMRQAVSGTPVGPLFARLADAVRDAARDNRTSTRFAFAQRGKGSGLVLSEALFSSRSGAKAGLGEVSRFTMAWPGNRWALDGSVTMDGGGLPKGALRLAQRPGGGLGGQLFVDPYTAGDSRLALEPVRFTARPDGSTGFSTVVTLDGPIGDGMVKGLSLPVDGRFAGGRLSMNPHCAPLSVNSLNASGAAIGKTKLSLCPVDGRALFAYGPGGVTGGALVRFPRIAGRMGSSPMRLSADSMRFTLADAAFAASNVDWSVGPETSPVRLVAATLSGKAGKQGVAGKMAGVSGRIGAVPLLVEDAAGDWRFVNGALSMGGSLMLRDTAVPDRFNPLASRDFTLGLKDSVITAKGTLVEPRTGAMVATTNIVHRLGNGKGQADLDVPGITFTSNLQPEDITRLALGVVANARGTVTGRGQVRWDGDKVTSDGDFGTDSMDLAAAFGPVSGLSGRMHFIDLIGLVTADNQEVKIASANPGIEVTDGVVRYHLEPGQKVRIEGGHWPFSGGDLNLLPTTMDFSADTERYMTFRVIGLDAGAFIQKLELENVSATGTFDGIMPLIFNAQGGRIAGGVLVARQSGLAPLIMPEGVLPSIPCDPTRQSGTLSYIGPVSNEQVGVMGKLAFDALKDLQYKCLTILMDGALDGELVTNVVFNGVNRGKLTDAPESIARNFIGLPFLFNVRIQAPFRGLLTTAKSFVDPSGLVRDHLGDDYQEKLRQQKPTEGVAVQPSESEKALSGEQK